MLDFKRYYIICFVATFLFSSCLYDEIELEGTIRTIEVTDITSSSATIRGSLRITTDRRTDFHRTTYINNNYENGFSFSLSPNPTIYDSAIVGRRVTGTIRNNEFVATITGLQRNTTYFVRAYTTTRLGTFYGNEISFTTLFEDPSPFFILGDIMIDERDNDPNLNLIEARLRCERSVSGGFTNWRLPRIEELARIYGSKDEIGGFTSSRFDRQGYPYYWSDTFIRTVEVLWGNPRRYYYVINFNRGLRSEFVQEFRGEGLFSAPRMFSRCVRYR